MKRIYKLGLITLLAFCICMNPVVLVSAAAGKEFSDPIIVKESQRQVTVSGKWTGRLTASADKPAAIITVKSGFKGELILENVTIKLSGKDGDYACALNIEPGAHPKIVLKGNNTLSSGNYRAGIEIPKKAKVTFSGTGKLTVTGGNYGAGIGGADKKSCGTVDIGNQDDSPRINANGGTDAAGIGGGRNGSGGTVYIFGGLVNAIGNGDAQDIGYGVNGKAGKTSVSDARLLRYDKIGWDETDSKARQEVKFVLNERADPDSMDIDIIDPTSLPRINIGSVPLPEGGTEDRVAYLYIPSDIKKLTVNITVTNTSRVKSEFGYAEPTRMGGYKLISKRIFNISKNKTIEITYTTINIER